MRIVEKVVVEKEVVKYVKVFRDCKECGKRFEAKRINSYFCSRLCGKRNERKRHADKYRAKAKSWYRNNLELAAQKRKERYWKNPELWREKTREWNEQNREYKSRRDCAYKDWKRHGGRRSELLKKHGLVCSRCGKAGDRFHIVAHHSTFDKTDHANQELLCRSCHAKIHH